MGQNNNNNHQSQGRMYSKSELEEAMSNVATATAELTKNSVLETLKEKNLLKEETEPGNTKKLLAGLFHRSTKGIINFGKETIAEGESVLMQSAMKSLDEKAEAKEREEFEKQLKAKYNR